MSKLIFEISKTGRRAVTLPKSHVPSYDVPEKSGRKAMPHLPEVAEIDLVRHYTNLSHMAHGVDNGFYPLGSCTMKYNPKINEETAALPALQTSTHCRMKPTHRAHWSLCMSLKHRFVR